MINSLYFHCYYAFLRGDFPETKMYYDFLKEEFGKKKDINALKSHQLHTLKKIREAITTGNLPRGSWMNETPIQGPPTQPTAKFKQNELVWKINKEIDQLKEILKKEEPYLKEPLPKKQLKPVKTKPVKMVKPKSKKESAIEIAVKSYMGKRLAEEDFSDKEVEEFIKGKLNKSSSSKFCKISRSVSLLPVKNIFKIFKLKK